MTKLQEQKYTVDGLTVRVVRSRNAKKAANKQPPLLVLNGIGVTVDAMHTLIGSFDGRDVIAFDIPQANYSNNGCKRIGMRRYATLTNDLVNQLGHSSVDILGYSWGGALAQEFVRRFPERCNKLVLVATSPGHMMVPGRGFFSLKGLKLKSFLSPRALLEMAAGPGSKSLIKENWKLGNSTKTGFSNTAVYVQQAQALIGWSSLPWLNKIKSKTLIVHAKDDQLVSSLNARILSRLIPDAQLVLSEKGGHLFLLAKGNNSLSMIKDVLHA